MERANSRLLGAHAALNNYTSNPQGKYNEISGSFDDSDGPVNYEKFALTPPVEPNTALRCARALTLTAWHAGGRQGFTVGLSDGAGPGARGGCE